MIDQVRHPTWILKLIDGQTMQLLIHYIKHDM